ncbi:DUF1761 domain-containing protein [Pseudorhodobacter sp.]|uniref:DUF1761 domain-containing protein n=1 Tax=Pseudorhodobacter sp. TaxID=1934400 RepID=UPI00264728FE|nr:DUF1761 domain-containing protein [Pseudorhodobacter sp.]MDN5787915.1 DUF1761 domain-containing protein [Pseudorhodobacter sp.]
MEILSILVAAAASWVFGAVWYMTLSRPWLKASGIKCDANGKPEGGSALPYLLSALCMLIVAGMMRHVFASAGVDAFGAGLLGGLGIGSFFIAPWIMINNAYAMRPFTLTLIDGGYAVFGCGLIGAILTLF